MKYAIVEDGGKQYKVSEGGQIEVDRIPFDTGEEVDLENVLLISEDDKVTVGAPYIPGAVVQAKVVAQTKGPKVIIFKYKPKKRYRVKTGHRQQYTLLSIESIVME